MQPMQPGYGAPPPGYGAPPQAAPVAGKNPAIALFVIALIIAVGAFTHSWAKMSQDHEDESMEIGAGLIAAKASACYEGHCQDGTVDWGGTGGDRDDEDSDKSTNDLKYLGYLAFLGALGAIGLCGAAGGLVLSGNARKIKIPAFVGIVAAGGGVMVPFLLRVVTKDLGGDPSHLTISWSGFLAIGGCVAGAIVIGSGLGPVVRAAQAMPMAMAMPMGGQPMPMGGAPYGQPLGQPQPPMQQAPQQPPQMAANACPRCGGALTYVAQYQRNFCHACQQYA